jgi:hypothetical protein
MLEVNEALNAIQRAKMKMAFKKSASKRKIGQKKALNKVASGDKLKDLAHKKAKDIIIKKILKGKSKSDLPIAARDKLEKKVKKKAGVIAKLAKKIMPKVKADNKARVAAHKANK